MPGHGVAVVQRGQSRARLEWEIDGNGQPLPARLCEANFISEGTAKVALREFLQALDREQNP
jgi:hypothetical protein